MAANDYDLFVIGAGSGGVRAARIAAEHGAKVGIAEEYRVGGTCVIRGCIPKKLLVYASHFREDFEDAKAYGWEGVEPGFSWSKLIRNKDAEIERLSKLYVKNLEKAGAKLHRGRARLTGPHAIQAGNEAVTADTILIATGNSPWVPDFPGAELGITSNEAFHLERLPERILITGAGYIAVEFAGIFSGLGVEVTIAYRRNKVLRGFDQDLRERLTTAMSEKGVNFLFETTIAKTEKAKGELKVNFNSGEYATFDAVMHATGRLPNTRGLGLREIGVELTENGAVAVDQYSKSSVDHIFAVGDVTDRRNLTPVAIHEGHAFALTKFGGKDIPADHEAVASAVFSQPPLATVGPTEAETRRKYGQLEIYESEFTPLKHSLTGRGPKTYVKLLVDAKSRKMVAAHMLGEDSPEIIQAVAIAVKAGLTKEDFDRTCAIHPTTAEELVLLSKKRG